MPKNKYTISGSAGDTIRLMALRSEWPNHKWTSEYYFHDTRRWRFDFAELTLRIAVEIEGGSRQGGRHNRHDGFVKDMEKYNRATVLGWKLLRCTPAQFDNGTIFQTIHDLMKGLNT